MADGEDDEAFLYGDDEDEKKTETEKENNDASGDKPDEAEESKENIKPEEEESTENGEAKPTDDKDDDDDDAKEAGELSNEDDEDDDDDDDDDDDVQVTIDEINTSGTGYGTPYATPVNWNFKGGAVGSANKGAATPAAGSKHLDLNAEGTVNGVGIYEFDLESAEERPWRKPGADITDYFNYGFTEDTWKQYCEKQRRMRLELSMQKKIFAHHAGAPAPTGQGDMTSVITADVRTRKAGPPPERRMEGSIDVIGAVGSRVESRRHQDEDMMPPHMMPDGMSKRGFPGPPMFNVPTSDPSMGPPQHMGGPPVSSMAGPPPMGVPPRFPPGGPPGGPGMPGMLPPGMQQPPPGMNQPPGGFPPDGMPHDSMGFPGRGMGRGRGRGFHPGMPGMPPPGEFPPGMDERGGRIPFEDGMPHFYPGDPSVQPFPPMMGPPPHGLPWETGMGRGFMPNFRDQFPVGMPRPGGESPGRGGRSDEDSEYGSSGDERRREREHKKRDKDKERERSREHRERTRDRHSDRDRSPRRERDRRDRDRESRRHRDRDKDREKGSDRDREKREERSSRRSKEQREKKRHKGSSEVQSADGQEEGEVVSKRRSRRTRESKQAEAKPELAEQEEGQLSSP